MLDVAWLMARSADGLGVMADCRRLVVAAGAGGDQVVDLVRRALALSMSELRQDPRRLPGQLVGRLMGSGEGGVAPEAGAGEGGDGDGGGGVGCVPACRPASRGNRLLAGSRPLPAAAGQHTAAGRSRDRPAAPAVNRTQAGPGLATKAQH